MSVKINDVIDSSSEVLDSKIREIEIDFLKELEATYGTEVKGWRICGPANSALARILSELLNVPFGKDLPGEHIEIGVGVYAPMNKSGNFKTDETEEQTYTLYYDGKGNVYYIDPIYGLLMEKGKIEQGTIKVGKTKVDSLEDYLEENFNVYIGDNLNNIPAEVREEPIRSFGGRSIDKMVPSLNRHIRYMNDYRGVMPYFLENDDDGEVIQVFSPLREMVPDIVKKFAPNWESGITEEDNVVRKALSQVVSKGRPSLMQVLHKKAAGQIFENQPPVLEEYRGSTSLICNINNTRYVLRRDNNDNYTLYVNAPIPDRSHAIVGMIRNQHAGLKVTRDNFEDVMSPFQDAVDNIQLRTGDKDFEKKKKLKDFFYSAAIEIVGKLEKGEEIH